jgi:uncharacterized protein (TIGR02391 family)
VRNTMSQIQIKPFSLSALERIAEIIGDRYTGSGITEFFRKAGFPQIRHDGTTKWRFVYGALEQIQSSTHGPYQIAAIIQQLCDPQEYFGNAETHRQIVNEVNEILSFYALAVNAKDGKVVVTGETDAVLRSRESEEARLFDSRGFHPEVKKHARLLFLEGRHFHAVFECCKAFDKYVRQKSKLDKHGSDLISAALSLKGPLKLNAQRTETERNEQEGLMHLCMGLMRAVRNPESHEPELDWPITREDALDILSLISFLYRQVDKAVFYAGS